MAAAIKTQLLQLIEGLKVHKDIALKEVQATTEAQQALGDFGPAENRNLVVFASQNVQNYVTKFSLAYKDAKTIDECGGFGELVEKSIIALIQASKTMLPSIHANAILSTAVTAKVVAIIDAISNLAKALAERQYANNNIPKLTGVVYHGCDSLEAMAFDNKAIVLEHIRANMATIKDSVTELEESAEEAGDAPSEDDEDDDMDEEDGILDVGGSMTKEEAKVVPGCVLLLRTCGSFIGQLVKIIDTVPTPDTKAPEFAGYNQWLVVLHSHAQAVTLAVDGLVESVYSPQVKATVLEKAKAVKEEIDRILANCLKTALVTASPTAAGVLARLEGAISGFLVKAILQIEHP